MTPIRVKKLGHFVYEVSDVDRSTKFWTDIMGFIVTDRNDKGMVFLRCASDHHSIALVPSENKSRGFGGLRFHHLAMEVENIDALFEAREFLKSQGYEFTFEGRRGAGCNIGIEFIDPDGYNFELYCEMDQLSDDIEPRPAELFRPAKSLEEAISNPVTKTW
jgi:catechol 2,3-dioxygenase-like lactoylglutathione lyase family enzyme